MALSDVGTQAWARRTGGNLSRRDRAELMRQGILLQLKLLPTKLRKRFGLTPPGLARVDWARLRIPDSPMARRAEQMLQETSPEYLVNHSHRTYLWGAILARHDTVDYDEELLYVACLLHDLGLTDQFNGADAESQSPSYCFAVEGAKTAELMAQQALWPEPRRDSLYEAISLHLNPSVGLEHGPEAHLLNAGAALEVSGMRKWNIDPETVNTVLNRYPRKNFKHEIDLLMRKQISARSCCRAHFLYDKMQFGEVIKRAPFRE